MKENWFKILISICLVVIAGIVGYYYLSYIPKRDNQNQVKADQEKQELTQKQEEEKTKFEEEQKAKEQEVKDQAEKDRIAKQEADDKKAEEDRVNAQTSSAQNKRDRDKCLAESKTKQTNDLEANKRYNSYTETYYTPINVINQINQEYKDDNAECYKRYPTN